MRFLRLPQSVEIGVFGVGLTGVAWVLYASFMYVEHSRVIAANEARFERQKLAFETLLGEVAAYQAKIANLSRTVKERQSDLMSRLYEAESVEDPGGEEPAARDALHEQLALIDGGLRAITETGRVLADNLAATASDLEAAVVESNEAVTAHLDLWERLRVTQEELRQSQEIVAGMQADLDTTKPRFEAAVQQRLQAVNAWHELKDQYVAVQEQLRQAQETVAVMQADLDTTKPRLEAAVQQRLQALNAWHELQDQYVAVQEQLRQAQETVAVMQADLDTTKPRLEAAVQQRLQALNAWHELQDQYVAVQEQLRRKIENTAVLQNKLAAVTAGLEEATDERTKVAQNRNWLRLRVKDLEQNLKTVSAAQQRVLARLSRQAAGRIERLERIIDFTGVDKDQLTAAADITPIGQGGPFIPAGPIDQTVDLLASAVATLDLHLDRWRGLEHLMRRLPLAAPVTGYYVSSPYGLRKDPYTKRWSMHRGVDLAGMLRSPIYATAPGVVTLAGSDGSNGKMVEIDHGMNIRTRYGHVGKVLVKKGERVGFRTKLALMGSTGRSTGPHLHYEIWANGRTYDPMKFIEAGRYLVQDIPAMKPVDLEHPIRAKPERKRRS